MSMQSGGAPRGYDIFSTLSPEQKQIFSQIFQSGGMGQSPLFGQGQNYLQNLLSGSPEAFSAFEAPFKRQFNEQTVPGLAERFAGMGAGAQSSSAFQNALGQAGAGLSENLAQLRSGLQMQALPHALSYAQQPINNLMQLLGTQTQGLVQKPQSFIEQLMLALSGGLGQAGGAFAGSKFLK